MIQIAETIRPAMAILHSEQSATQADALYALGKLLREHRYRFITPTPATIARVAQRPGNNIAHGLTCIFGWSRLFSAATVPPVIFDAMLAASVVRRDGDFLRSTVRASSIGDTLYFHSAFPTTAADAVFFGPDTYRFVRELHVALPSLGTEPRRCVDIGCGAGAGAIALALACPDADVLALDINEAALALTSVNAALAGAGNVVAQYSNLLKNVGGSFDLIISNPPFLMDRDERTYRHGGGELGADLSLAIVEAAIARLSPGGTLLLYTGSAIVEGVDMLRAEALALLARAGLQASYEEIDPDIFGEELAEPAYAKTDRIAAIWLKATKPHSPLGPL